MFRRFEIFDSVLNIFYSDCVIHYSQVTGKIVGYTHNFFNQKNNIRNGVFFIFFVMKGLRFCVWKTNNLRIGGKEINNISYVNIADQIKFIDTIKFYQEPLSKIAKSEKVNEKGNIKRSLIVFFLKHTLNTISSLTF